MERRAGRAAGVTAGRDPAHFAIEAGRLMEAASFGLGCVLGFLLNFGAGILFAIYDISIWWLIPVAVVSTLLAKPIAQRYAIFQMYLERGHLGRAIFAELLVPVILGFSLQAAVYWVTTKLI